MRDTLAMYLVHKTFEDRKQKPHPSASLMWGKQYAASCMTHPYYHTATLQSPEMNARGQTSVWDGQIEKAESGDVQKLRNESTSY